MSCRQSLLSNPTETLMDSRISDGAPENRPESALSLFLVSVIRLIRTSRRQSLRSAECAVLYALALTGAICAEAAAFERQPLAALQEGTMRKLVVHDSPKPVSVPPMLTEAGAEEKLSDHFGPVLVVNFWATWCAPCRKEMPSLDRLQAQFPPEDVKVIAVAAGRNEKTRIRSFLESVNAENLTVRLDPKLKLAAALRVRGLPATILLSRDGEEVARLVGDAEWDSASAVRILRHIADLP